MSDKSTDKQQDQLKQLKEKPLPPNVRKAVDKKIASLGKQINK